MNKSIIFDNDIKYKSHWYFIGKSNNLIYSYNSFIEIYKDIDINLYKYIYNTEKNCNDTINLSILRSDKELCLKENNGSSVLFFGENINNDDLIINIYDNIDNLICSFNSFKKYIDDFDYLLFIKNFPVFKKNDKDSVINHYIKNIEKINIFFSEKIFNIKYPLFNIEEYKLIYEKDGKNINIINDYNNLYNLSKNKNYIYISINDFYLKNPSFDIKLYKYHLKINNITFYTDIEYIKYFVKNNYINYKELYKNINMEIFNCFNVPFLDDVYKILDNFNKDVYRLINKLDDYSEEELVLHYHKIGIHNNLVCNLSMLDNYIDFSIKIYRELNKDLCNLNDNQLFNKWYYDNNNNNNDRICSITSFQNKYPEYTNLFLFEISENGIINWMNNDIYKYIKEIYNDNTIIGRKIVNNIYEVLIDLNNKKSKESLEKGISLVIRAKNEELNIKYCIESVIDLVDEIIFVDNNSSDKTYSLVEEYAKNNNKIKLYQYNINVSKVGIEHQTAIQNNNKNTLGTFYNWCLSKVSKINVFKWDADFLCIRNNFKQLVDNFNLRVREDKFAVWFTGNTLFEKNNNFYLNINSYYNEYRIFSYKNNFCWYDGNTCEYTDPYLNSCQSDRKYIYNYPLFYELKRTSINEFEERSSLIDIRDINDFNILNNLKNDITNNLIKIDKKYILKDSIKIIIFTPSLSVGGGNQFIINMYKFYKSLGFIINIIPLSNETIGNKKFNIIEKEDILYLNKFNIEYIKKFCTDYIIFNSSIPFDDENIRLISINTKIIFITHSDIAFSNSYIEKYHDYFFKIITVNNYTIDKIIRLLNINQNKFFKLINYSDMNNTEKNRYIAKNKSFGIISRFSEDKNIPMLLISLCRVFNKYPDYKFYLIGTHTEYYDNYLKYLCNTYNLNNNVIFKGYQNDVSKFYKILDFIILPSVSEGCSYNIIEGMSYGLPIICSDVGGNHELIKNNINGIIYPYTNIKKYEENTLFIMNYNKQLTDIGYFENNNNFLNNYNIINDYNKIEVIIPFSVKCKINFHNNNNNNNCKFCNSIKSTSSLFNQNINTISNSILKMITILNNEELHNEIKNNNINFINEKFNKYIYTSQCLDLFNYFPT
jgi:glycosyltransferase involved in cell wall biosynthesis